MKLIDRVVERKLNSWWWRYHSTWLFTLLALIVTEWLTQRYQLLPRATLMYAALALSVTLGGMRSALFGSLLVIAYTWYHYEAFGPLGFLLANISALAIALGGGYLKNHDRRQVAQIERLKVISEINQAKIQFVDDLNGNIEASNKINQELVSIIAGEQYLTKGEIISKLLVIQNWAADLAQRTVGWHKLYEEKRAIIEAKDE